MFVEKNNDISFCNEYGHIYHMSWCDVTADCYTIRIDRFTSFRFNRFSSFFMTNQSNDILLLKKNDKLSYYQNRSLDTLLFRFQIRVVERDIVESEAKKVLSKITVPTYIRIRCREMIVIVRNKSILNFMSMTGRVNMKT